MRGHERLERRVRRRPADAALPLLLRHVEDGLRQVARLQLALVVGDDARAAGEADPVAGVGAEARLDRVERLLRAGARGGPRPRARRARRRPARRRRRRGCCRPPRAASPRGRPSRRSGSRASRRCPPGTARAGRPTRSWLRPEYTTRPSLVVAPAGRDAGGDEDEGEQGQDGLAQVHCRSRRSGLGSPKYSRPARATRNRCDHRPHAARPAPRAAGRRPAPRERLRRGEAVRRARLPGEQEGVRFCSGKVDTWDGHLVDTNVTLPATGDGPFPLIILSHGWGGRRWG